jgi:hypothetical protein
LHSCPCPPNSVSSFFLLCFNLAPLSPSHFWWVFNCSFVIAGNLVQLLFHHDEFGDCFCTVGASLLYCMCMACLIRWFPYTWSTVPFVLWLVYHYHIVCMYYCSRYTVHGTVASVHPLYSTQVLFSLPSRWCVTSHYSIICMYSSTRRMVR